MPTHHTAIYSLTATCPRCLGELRLRTRHDGQGSFVGCSAYPSCTYTAPYDAVLHALGTRLAAAEARGHVPALSLHTLEKDLKRLMAIVHPDKWRDHPLATEVAKHVNAIRASLKR